MGDRPIGAGRGRSTHPRQAAAAAWGRVWALVCRRPHSHTVGAIRDRFQGLAAPPRQRISRVRAGPRPAGRAAAGGPLGTCRVAYGVGCAAAAAPPSRSATSGGRRRKPPPARWRLASGPAGRPGRQPGLGGNSRGVSLGAGEAAGGGGNWPVGWSRATPGGGGRTPPNVRGGRVVGGGRGQVHPSLQGTVPLIL